MCFFGQWAANAKSTESQPNSNLAVTLTRLLLVAHDETYTRGRDLSYLAFRFVFRAGAAMWNVADAVSTTSAPPPRELQ